MNSRAIAGVFGLTMAFAPCARPQSRNIKDVAVGKLLVASARVTNATFRQTVVLIVAANDKEVAGLILNRPSDKSLAQAFPTVASASQRTDSVFVGGPVEKGHSFAVLHSDIALHEANRVVGKVFFTPLQPLIEMALNAERTAAGLRVFLGYSGWSHAQLEGEVASGDWLIVPAQESDIFSDPEQLWQRLSAPPATQQTGGSASESNRSNALRTPHWF